MPSFIDSMIASSFMMVLDGAAKGSLNVCRHPFAYLFSHKSLVFCCVPHGHTQGGSNQSPSPLLSLLCLLTHFRAFKANYRPLDIPVTRMQKNPRGIPGNLSTSRAVVRVGIVARCSMGKSLVMCSYAWLGDEQTDEGTAVVRLMCCDTN